MRYHCPNLQNKGQMDMRIKAASVLVIVFSIGVIGLMMFGWPGIN
ncbi:hypothetical protein NV379_25525 [Paenibacillus sp. N1-5-1-14]|nr:hypothetical protein [Paenibacillus radicibacter]MCR8645987.1 hypothetical protein [Paenibacillus radicibacter]